MFGGKGKSKKSLVPFQHAKKISIPTVATEQKNLHLRIKNATVVSI
jgi:hypothetical protein